MCLFTHGKIIKKLSSHLEIFDMWKFKKNQIFAVCLDLAHGKDLLCRVPNQGTRQMTKLCHALSEI